MNLILLGAPGSGKGTQAEALHLELKLPHVASGDIFRDNLRRETRLGLLAREYMNRGQLVPDEITIDLVKSRLASPDAADGVILDGFPRTVPQAKALGRIMEGLDRRIDGVLCILVPDEELVRRLSGRLICRECQAPFHRLYNPFRVCPEKRCQGEYLYQREDDRPEVVRARLRTYHSLTAPLIDYYRNLKLLFQVEGAGTVREVTHACLEVVRSLGTASEHSTRS